jgi:hypothetical protein
MTAKHGKFRLAKACPHGCWSTLADTLTDKSGDGTAVPQPTGTVLPAGDAGPRG